MDRVFQGQTIKEKTMETGRAVRCYDCGTEIDEWQAYEWHLRYHMDGSSYHEYLCPQCMAKACLAHGLTVEAMDIHKEHCTGCSFCERGD